MLYSAVLLARAYLAVGRIFDSKRCAIASARRLPADLSTARLARCAISCYSCLGACLYLESASSEDRVGTLEQCVEAYRKAISIIERTGGDSSDCYCALSSAHLELGMLCDATIALECALRSVAHFVSMPVTGSSRVLLMKRLIGVHAKLAAVLMARRRFGGAVEHYIYFLNSCEELGVAAFSITKVYVNLAQCLRALSRLDEALSILDVAWKRVPAPQAGEREDIVQLCGTIRTERGHVHLHAGRWKMALDEYARAEHILRSIFGESDPRIGCVFLHRGDVFACQYAEGADEGVFTLAHSWYDRALENALHTLPEDDAHAIMCRARFGRLYSMAKNEARAMHVMKECLELSKAHAHIGSQHSKLRASLCVSIADMLRHGSDVQQEEAFALYAEALRTFSKTVGAEAIELGPVYMGMALLWSARGEASFAQRHFSAAESEARRHLGVDHPVTLHCAQAGAVALSMLGKSMREEAIAACAGVLSRIEKAKRVAARKKRALGASSRSKSGSGSSTKLGGGTRRHALSSSTTTAGMNVLELRAARLEGGAGSAVSSFLSEWMNLRPAARTLRDVRARLQRSAHGSRTVR